MKRILLVHVHPAAEGTTRRHLPYWEKAGYDRVVGILTEGSGCEWWPTADWVKIGENKYIDGPHLCNRLIRTFEYGIQQGADDISVIEHDTVLFKPIPYFPTGFTMNRTGGNIPPWKSTQFFHNLWGLDVATAIRAVALGDVLINQGDIEGGNPDLFMGRITDLMPDVPINQGVFRNFTRNALDRPGDLELARQAYRDGVDVIHGIKKESELSFILA